MCLPLLHVCINFVYLPVLGLYSGNFTESNTSSSIGTHESKLKPWPWRSVANVTGKWGAGRRRRRRARAHSMLHAALIIIMICCFNSINVSQICVLLLFG